MKRSKQQTRLRILDAAFGLFWRQGFLRVSMDEIAARAGITKRALYQHFPSKDDLMAATLAHSSNLAIERLRAFPRAGEPGKFIDSFFADLSEWASKPKWSGGGFTRVVVELADLRGHPARAIARSHKTAVEQWLADGLASGGVASRREHAREIMLLTEGAMALMLIHGDRSYAQTAARAAKRLVRGE
ncbi:MAG TPA: helix-turn-helix domain-containing protein [Pseudolabrys sp.]|nr:helix-turn-helix domain-containing protein [Pseudolabrys sp.]